MSRAHEIEGSVRTTCPYCGVGCGIIASVEAGGMVSVRGDAGHPANHGRLCSKGSALGETLGSDGRLLTPRVHGQESSWEHALDLVARTFTDTIAKHGPDSVAFYVSGQILTEDYYVANKLMKGYIGSANIDTNSRLCMASSVAGHRRAFGSDTVPGCYEDLELADLVVLTGSNLAWCHPVLYQRLAAAKEKRPQMKIVLIDPRETATAAIADLHLPIRPDADVALFAGLLGYLVRNGVVDETYIAAHTTGFAPALSVALDLSESDVCARTGLDADKLQKFFQVFAKCERAVTVYSQGINQSASGTDKVNAIINCHLATGRIGRPGMGPFSVTGQPNAMGGREVGGLANMLAAHMDIDNAAHRDLVQRFWRSPAMAAKPGLKAVDMFDAVADGRIKALWVMGTNPAVSMPQADAVAAALAACPFVVVSDVVRETATLRSAHVQLPAAAWGEKDGTVTNSERRISRQRPFLEPPGSARADWWIICEVAKRMGFDAAFTYGGPSAIFAEHAALSAFENGESRDFDIGGVAQLTSQDYDALTPFQWPRPAGTDSKARMFAEGNFFTADRKARFIATPLSKPQENDTLPFVLNTGRVRDQWHTMTRTGRSPRLSQHAAEPYAEINPADAAALGIADACIVRVSNDTNHILVRALLSRRQQPGSIFVPMHWQEQFASCALVDALVGAKTDAVSGQPALKQSAVRIAPFRAEAYAFAVVREKPKAPSAAYWAIARCNGGWRVELAFDTLTGDWQHYANELLGASSDVTMLSYHDETSGQHRFAAFAGEVMQGALFVAPEPVAVSRDWAVALLQSEHAATANRLRIIAGRPGKGVVDKGATVCSCFGVGANQIAGAVRAGCHSLAAVGDATQAGTNCGSCRSEILSLIEQHSLQAAE